MVGVPVAGASAALPAKAGRVPSTVPTVVATRAVAGPLPGPPRPRVETSEDGVAAQGEGGQPAEPRPRQVTVQRAAPGASEGEPVELFPAPELQMPSRGGRIAASQADFLREVELAGE